MSDEEYEAFSASEEEWKPGKGRGGESSDDDDSDFDEVAAGSGGASGGSRKRESDAKGRGAVKSKGSIAKKRKPTGQSLRTKLYNKYRPPPRTFLSPTNSGGTAGSNSPSASTSRTASKNVKTPNESNDVRNDGAGGDSSSDCSVDDYLVDPADLDLQSSFFNRPAPPSPPPPVFDCNAGLANLSDSGSEDNNDSSADEAANSKAFDFRNLLEKANSLERAKETIAKRAAEAKTTKTAAASKAEKGEMAATDSISSLLALGEQLKTAAQSSRGKCDDKNDEEDDDDDDDDEDGGGARAVAPQRLSKTKSTRVKRHTKTRPTSTVMVAAAAAGDSDDSEFEEVADEHSTTASTTGCSSTQHSTANDSTLNGSLEIHVALPTRERAKQTKSQLELEMSLKRKLNRNLKERQLHLHKTTLLCCLARNYIYNRQLNDAGMLLAVLKLLPNNNVYPPERGTEIKYFQSFVRWYVNVMELTRKDFYPPKRHVAKEHVRQELLEQVLRKQATSKQDYVMIFVSLARAMGIQARLVVNLTPLPIRPPQTDLVPIKAVATEQRKSSKKTPVVPCKEPKLESADEMQKSTTVSDMPKHSTSQSAAAKRKQAESTSAAPPTSKPKLSRLKSSEPAGPTTSAAATAKATKVTTVVKPVVKVDSPKEPNIVVEGPTTSSREISNTRGRPTGRQITAKERPKNVNSKSTTAKLEAKTRKARSASPAIEVSTEFLKTAAYKAKFGSDEQASDMPKQSTSQSAAAKRKQAESASAAPPTSKPKLSRLKSSEPAGPTTSAAATAKATKVTTVVKPVVKVGSPKVPDIVVEGPPTNSREVPNTRGRPTGRQIAAKERPKNVNSKSTTAKLAAKIRKARSASPAIEVSAEFLKTAAYKAKFGSDEQAQQPASNRRTKSKSPTSTKVQVSSDFLRAPAKRVLRPRQKTNEATEKLSVPQLDGGDDNVNPTKERAAKRPQLRKLKVELKDENDENHVPPVTKMVTNIKSNTSDVIVVSDNDFSPSSSKRPKKATVLPKRKKIDRRVLTSDEDESGIKSSPTLAKSVNIWAEVFCDVEDRWISVNLFTEKVDAVDSVRRSASGDLAYVFAFQNDLSLKDVTARYCAHWTKVVRKERVESAWLDTLLGPYLARRTARDRREDQELRRIHEAKPLPTSIGDFKDHPLYALERHLLKFQGIYPPNAPTIGFVRGEPIYSRDCVHLLHSRDIWLKQARTVKLGEQPYKVVKARPKWDRLTQTVIKDQPLEIFGYWQTQQYEPPTAENGIVPRNAYGNVELFKECMLPKKTVHLRMNGLNRVCKKLGIDCANAVIGFDFHQGSCHPLYDGFVVCEEFAEQVTDAWLQDQEDQQRKEKEKQQQRVWGNWKKLIRAVLIRERLKKKYNF